MNDRNRRARLGTKRGRGTPQSRREVLRKGFLGLGLLMSKPLLTGCSDGNAQAAKRSNIANIGALGAPDENGVRLPSGFTSRILARSTERPLESSSYIWHGAPDGGATFPTENGGWIYVSNCEIPTPNGGAGALRFDRQGTVVDAYRILEGTNFNCAGGPTPWATWLSCEEDFAGRGMVWECDPTGKTTAIARPAMGLFTHEAVTVDPEESRLYMTEDQPDGRFYRFTPERYPDLSSGVLEVARAFDPDALRVGNESRIEWLRVPDPGAVNQFTRHQVPESSSFLGGEGIWYREGVVYFATKLDNRIWAYSIGDQSMSVLYNDDELSNVVLRGVDNVTASADGDVLVAEDGDDMQVVAITPSGEIVPLLQIDGHSSSEVTGPAFDPSGTRLYFSSQRGPTGAFFTGGVTYEVSGPFVV